jgi:hypothetical protein
MAGDQTLPGATVERVVAIAKRLNPTVAAASLDFDAAVHKIGTAGVLADPTLILAAWDVNSLGVGQRRFGVEQEFKLWGKYGLERNIALADADAARFQGRAIVTELIAQVVAAHGGDVVRRQGEQKSAAARLNALIGRLSLAPLAAPIGFRAVKPISLAQALARSANPMLALAGTQSNSAAQTKSLTDLNYYPDLTLGATYVQRPGTEDTGEFMAGFKVPLHYEVKDAEQRAAGARLRAAQARAEALRLPIDGQIADAWFGVDALRKVCKSTCRGNCRHMSTTPRMVSRPAPQICFLFSKRSAGFERSSSTS